MKIVLIVLALGFASFNAFAEGPILSCKAVRQGPRSDGKPGFETIDEKTFYTSAGGRFKVTELIGLTVKTYLDFNGRYVLVLIDNVLKSSATTSGSLGNPDINLSLDSFRLSNFITCDAL